MTTSPFPQLTLQCVNRLQQLAQYFGCSAGVAIERLMDAYDAREIMALKAQILTLAANQAATRTGLSIGMQLIGSTGLRRSTRRRYYARVVERGIEVNGDIHASLSGGANAAVVSAGRTGRRSGLDFWKIVDDSGRTITAREFLKRRFPR